MSVEVETRGLDALIRYCRNAPETADQAAVFATNRAAEFGRTLTSREIRDQVNFTASYLNAPGRLNITRRASRTDIEAVVTGRNRPTSLARFATTPFSVGPRRSKRGIRVRVARGGGATIPGAFFVRLRGAAEGSNEGLAIRTKGGRPPSGTRGAKPIFKGAYLLYGPSIGQVAHDVFPAVVDRVGDKQVDEFMRQFERMSHAR